MPTLESAFDLLLVILGFSLIIIIHELGHFLAARWARVRVLAFAVGFGPALVSYRRGLGVRRGSSEAEYESLVKQAKDRSVPGARRKALDVLEGRNVSATEYRLNALPLGGYVKMLGQDDADPGAVSTEPDSYQNAPVWKRMVIISAGVVFNVISALLLFMAVFALGLKTEPPVVGRVAAGSPAASAVATNAEELGVRDAGLMPLDRVVLVGGSEPLEFQDVALEAMMSARGEGVEVHVEREGFDDALRFSIVPELNEATNLLMLGVEPARTGTILRGKNEHDNGLISERLSALGFEELAPDSELLSIDGSPATSVHELDRAVEASAGQPVDVEFRTPDGETVRVVMRPEPELQSARAEISQRPASELMFRHLLGLVAPMMVDAIEDARSEETGLRSGDVFARIDSIAWPTVPDGIRHVRSRKNKDVRITVYRTDENGRGELVELDPIRVSGDGKIGFVPADASSEHAIVTRWPKSAVETGSPSGTGLRLLPGSRVVSVDGRDVGSLTELRELLRAMPTGEIGGGVGVTLTVAPPPELESEGIAPEHVAWEIPGEELDAVAGLGYGSPLQADFFEPMQITLRAEGPVEAVVMGVHRTHNVMLMTYMTFVRLFQGTVKVEHLKGPVGIAHVGTIVADRGFVWLLFFMALISVNLAVINFLPFPIVDGGHFVYLLYESITGKPPPIGFQNAAALAGLVLIVSVFLLVTFNDISNLIG